MSSKLFKNCRHARRRLPEVFLSIQAVDKQLKPSYLWDAFVAGVPEIEVYLEDLYLQKLIDNKLNVFCIDDTVFVAHYNSLKLHLNTFSLTDIDLINVSQTVSVPSVVTTEEKIEILKPIMKYSQEILIHLNTDDENKIKTIDYTLCNPSTLFGILLGYPVLYWFSHQSPHSEFSCLSMLPLKVHKIVSNISFPCNFSKMYNNSKNIPMYHELYKFSIPQNVSNQTDNLVNNWFNMLTSKSKSNKIFSNLKITTDVISLPSVSM